MHRSASTSRASDEFSISLSPASKGSPGQKTVAIDDLPMYKPSSDVTKKDSASHPNSPGQNAVHIIPLVLILCALILWIFSHPTTGIMNNGGFVMEKMESLKINGHGNRSGLQSAIKSKDLGRPGATDGSVERSLLNKSR